jgi:hypothetical protein
VPRNNNNYPEVYYPPQSYTQYDPSRPSTVKPEYSLHPGYAGTPVNASSYGGSETIRYPQSTIPSPSVMGEKRGKTVCGCTFLVFVLSVIIAVLAVAVVGLAAGTGIQASRAGEAVSQLQSMSASLPTKTVTAPVPTSTSFATLTNNCSQKGETTSGQIYTTKCKSSATKPVTAEHALIGMKNCSLWKGDLHHVLQFGCSEYPIDVIVRPRF